MAAAEDSVWRAKVEKTIGASLETLVARSADGIEIAPLYERRRTDPVGGWRERATWAVAQRIDHPDTEAAHRLALAELEGGADALTLVFADSSFARGFGLSPDADLNRLLEGVELDLISLRLDAGPDAPGVTRALGALAERRTLTSASLDIDLGYDPMALAAAHWSAPDFSALPALLDTVGKAGLAGRPLLADGRLYHAAGASEALELSAVLATSVAYLRALEDIGLSLDEARRMVAMLLPVDADIYLGLAKMRAVRRLWARIEAASGLNPVPLRLHAETSWRMMTRRDPWTNVMRATAATFAAGLGGADAITVLPMTLAEGLPDESARRLARNVPRVLIDEANLAMVDDPAAGSGAIDKLTEELCERAWAHFQEIEREGGMAASLAAGALRARVARAALRRWHDGDAPARGIVGTNRFPSLCAPTPGVLDVAPRALPPRPYGGIVGTRDSALYELLRDRAEAMPERPTVFLAALGSPAAFGPSATWASNFFASAGLATTISLEERSVAELVEAFNASGAKVACICGDEQACLAEAPTLATALRGAGAKAVVLAGQPNADIVAAGVELFAQDGHGALDLLSAVLDAIGAEHPPYPPRIGDG